MAPRKATLVGLDVDGGLAFTDRLEQFDYFFRSECGVRGQLNRQVFLSLVFVVHVSSLVGSWC